MRNKTATRLSDLCDLVTDYANPKDRPGDIYVGLKHLSSLRFARTGQSCAADMRSTKHAFKAGDILYGKLGPYLGKAVLVEDEGLCTTELLVLRPKADVDPRFVVSVVHAPPFVAHAVAGTTGVGRPRTSWSHIAGFELPTFDSHEQSKIADLLWLVYETIAANEQCICAGKDVKRAAMQTLFTRGLRGEVQKESEIGPMPWSWDAIPIGAVFDIAQGLPLNRNLSDNHEGVPFLRTSNVYWARIDTSKISRMCSESISIGRRDLKPGDLLVCEGGEIGRAAVWNGQIPNCTFQNHLHRLRAKDPVRIVSKFAMSWLEEGFRHRFVYAGVGNRTTIPNLSRARLLDLKIPIPPLDEQYEIVAILDAIDRKIEMHCRKRDVLDDLFKASLHKLMTGEIRITNLDLSALTRTHNNCESDGRYAH